MVENDVLICLPTNFQRKFVDKIKTVSSLASTISSNYCTVIAQMMSFAVGCVFPGEITTM